MDTDSESQDFYQDVARSAFADMILDEDRNIRYRDALRFVIEEKHRRGEPANVVDIGTGSGLLSLAAAEAGADHVTAVEMFRPVADVAEKTFAASVYASRISTVKSRSTDLKDGNLSQKGNIIVAEVFDTELIGEGALRTFKEAHGSLVEVNSRVIPSSARVWVLPVQCLKMSEFNNHPQILDDFFECRQCTGRMSAFDFQMSQLVVGVDFLPLSQPFVAFRFNFENPDSIHYNEDFIRNFTVNSWRSERSEEVVAEDLNGSDHIEEKRLFDCVFMWWDLDMDGTGRNYITMAPTWWDADSKWRDHWMQAAYFLPHSVTVRDGEVIQLRCSHDEFAMWFEVARSDEVRKLPGYGCTLHLHSRNTFHRMNILDRNIEFQQILDEFCADQSIISLGECSLVGLYAARTARRVAAVERDPLFYRFLTDFVRKSDRICEKVSVHASVDELFAEEDFSAIVSESFCLPEIVASFNALTANLQQRADIATASTPKSFLRRISTFCVEVKFENLHKTVANIPVTLGFDLLLFNRFYQNARRMADSRLETHSLWEYPSVCTGGPPKLVDECVFCDDAQRASDRIDSKPLFPELVDRIVADGVSADSNALVFWTEAKYSNGREVGATDYRSVRISSGLLQPVDVGDRPNWSRSHAQFVYFLPDALERSPKK